MKRIYTFLTILAASLAVSCDMDKEPHGTLPDDEAILSPADCRSYRNGLYVNMRYLTTGPFVYYTDLQTDYFHAVTGNGNPMGNNINAGILLPSMEEFEQIWGTCYATIGSVNFLLSKSWPLIDSGEFSEEECIEMRRYIGEALFIRAYCYFVLAEKFCPAYAGDIAANPETGLPIVTTYDPTDDNSQYPGRNTLEETYAQIFADLDEALEYIEAFEVIADDDADLPGAMAPYVTSDVVRAMKARTALVTKNYQLALSCAEEVINTRNYSLEPSVSLDTFWEYDYGNEALMLVTMTQQYLGYATGSYYLRNTGNPYYILTQGAIDLFNKSTDNRFGVYFGQRTITHTESSPHLYVFTIFPGNPLLFTSVNNFQNMGKPFRISEQYLIAAEAAAEVGQESKANRYLNDLKARRMNGYTSEQQTGEVLINRIREERQRELFGEGFRFGDLKRWGLGFERSEGQDNSVINTNGNVHRVSYQPDDYRFVWPIPKAELDANPQLKPQQNPGY